MLHPGDDLIDWLAPSFPDAACRGQWRLYDHAASDSRYDDTVTRARADAIAICQRCPALDQCRSWVLGLAERNRPPGIVAGGVYRHRS